MISELIRSVILSSTTKPTADFLDKVIKSYRVLPQHIDFNIHVNNAKYLQFFERARWDHTVQTGTFHKLLKHKLNFIVAGIDVGYIRELRLFQTFDIETTYMGWDEKYFYLEQRCVANGKIHSYALVKAVMIKNGKPYPPEEACRLLGVDTSGNHIPEHMELWRDLSAAKRAFSQVQ